MQLFAAKEVSVWFTNQSARLQLAVQSTEEAFDQLEDDLASGTDASTATSNPGAAAANKISSIVRMMRPMRGAVEELRHIVHEACPHVVTLSQASASESMLQDGVSVFDQHDPGTTNLNVDGTPGPGGRWQGIPATPFSQLRPTTAQPAGAQHTPHTPFLESPVLGSARSTRMTTRMNVGGQSVDVPVDVTVSSGISAQVFRVQQSHSSTSTSISASAMSRSAARSQQPVGSRKTMATSSSHESTTRRALGDELARHTESSSKIDDTLPSAEGSAAETEPVA